MKKQAFTKRGHFPSQVNLSNLPFSFNTTEPKSSNVVSHFQIGAHSEARSRSTLLKIRQILPLKIIALSVAVPFFHIIDLAFAASKTFSITRAKFKDHIIKFGRLQFVKRKCQPLNISMNC